MKVHSPTEITKFRVQLTGLTDIMFDRYPGDNSTKLEPYQKFYFAPGNSKIIGIPAINLLSALSSHNTNSFPKRLRDKRKFKDLCNACLSFVSISPHFIPLLRKDKPIVFGQFEEDVDKLSGAYIHRSVARLDKGIPNPKIRPTIPCPWSIEFELSLFPNKEISIQEVQNLIQDGGQAMGIGTYRGVFGKFYISKWDKVK